MRKVDDGEKKKRKKEKKIMSFLVANNVIASRPPERRLTGTPHAHAKRLIVSCEKGYLLSSFSWCEYCQAQLTP